MYLKLLYVFDISVEDRLQDYIHAVQDAEARLDRVTRQIEELLPNWSAQANHSPVWI